MKRADVKAVLDRWEHPSTRRAQHAALKSFFDWVVSEEEFEVRSNVAREVRSGRRRPASRYRLNLAESQAMLENVEGVLERRAVFLGLCAGLRSSKLRGLRGIHFRRAGFVWVTSDIAKGGVVSDGVPVIPDLEAVVAEVVESVSDADYVLPAQRWRNPPVNTVRVSLTTRSLSQQALTTLVSGVAARAGVPGRVTSHSLRHGCADFIASATGDVELVAAVLGHADISTTQIYLSKLKPDQVAERLRKSGATYGIGTSVRFDPSIPSKATTRFELV